MVLGCFKRDCSRDAHPCSNPRARFGLPQDQSEPQNSDAHSEKNFPEDSGTAAVGWIQNILVGGFKHEFYFPFHIWENPSHWLIFFRGVETTNQYRMVTEKIQPCSGKNEPAVGFGVCLAGGFKGFFSLHQFSFPSFISGLLHTTSPFWGASTIDQPASNW